LQVRSALSAVLAAGVMLAHAAHADPVGRRLEVTPVGGYQRFGGGEGVGGVPLTDVFYIGGRVGCPLRPQWAIEMAGGFAPTRELSAGGADVDFYHGSGDVVFTPWEGLRGGPFAFAGGGAVQVKSAGSRATRSSFEAGGGLKLWITDGLGLRLEAREILYSSRAGNRVGHLMVGAGLVHTFGGRPRDSDGDGVPDRVDVCPDTPDGATVDSSGCTRDGDGDGVLDGLDRCPRTPAGAVVDPGGCPLDSDGDRVWDGLDQCPGTPAGATVDDHGCPQDSDQDGVWDGLDACSDTPAGATVDSHGCPHDTDGDGVPDGLDQCPDTTPGLRVDDAGCPVEVMEKESELEETAMIRLQDLRFRGDGAELLPEDGPSLDVVGEVLKQWPELEIEIGGHTSADSSADDDWRLSEARAEAVRGYLAARFPALNTERLTARGYGRSQPLVPNSSPLNRARNRRVELVVRNKDALRRETDRRRLLHQSEFPADSARATSRTAGR
jgi:OOP family OmpA-OmpF porin